MVPLEPEARQQVVSWLGREEAPGLLALRHALLYGRPGLWGDDARQPRCVVLLRPGDDGGSEAFGAGRAAPAVAWLAGRNGGVTLLAPDDWEPAVRAAVGPVDRIEVETWFDAPAPDPEPPGPSIAVRRLTDSVADADAFARATPDWALRGWSRYSGLIRHGAAYGVPFGAGFAAVAWTFDQTDRFDSVAVFTLPRYRRLGLGRAAATALLAHVVADRRKVPLWSAPPDLVHVASSSLAASLGFSDRVTETLLRWPPR
jgi:GNAT superfamily N-acetyltransferase